MTDDMVEQKFNIVDEKLASIDAKLDDLTELTKQTSLQEYRLTKLEESFVRYSQQGKDTAWKVLTPILSSITSAIIAFICAGGLSH